MWKIQITSLSLLTRYSSKSFLACLTLCLVFCGFVLFLPCHSFLYIIISMNAMKNLATSLDVHIYPLDIRYGSKLWAPVRELNALVVNGCLIKISTSTQWVSLPNASRFGEAEEPLRCSAWFNHSHNINHRAKSHKKYLAPNNALCSGIMLFFLCNVLLL